MEDFSEKTYEKTSCFYTIFSKSISNCTSLPSFTLWIFFFSKIWWAFQFNVHFVHFPPILRKNLWKDLPILWLIFKLPIIMCTLAKFCHLKIFTKNGGSFKMLTIYYSFRQLWAIFVTKLMKRSTIFFNILKLPLYFYMFTKFHDQQIKKKKSRLFQYVNKILLIAATLNNIFHKNYEKLYNFCNVFLKFVSIFILSRSFIMITFLHPK